MSDPISTLFNVKDFFKAIQSYQFLLGILVNGKEDYDEDDSDDECDVLPLVEMANELSAVRDVGYNDYSYCCGGLVHLEHLVYRNINIRYDTNYTSFDKCLLKIEDELYWLDNLPISDIIDKHCIVAPFGDVARQQTIVNPEVRTAYQAAKPSLVSPKYDVKAKNVYSPIVTFNSYATHSIINYILHKLSQHTFVGYESIRAESYRLNIYGPGGFFKEHKDTPIDSTLSIGTIVIVLPTKHTGGDLIIKHQDQSWTFQSDSIPANTIGWTAFYNDCPHQVQPVTSGYRVTLTYNVFINRDGCKPNEPYDYKECLHDFNIGPKIDLNPTTHLMKHIEPLIIRHKMGIVLNHEYTMVNLQPQQLKGLDHHLYQMLSTSYNCRLVSILINVEEYHGYEGENTDESNVYNVYCCSQNMWQSYITGENMVNDVKEDDACAEDEDDDKDEGEDDRYLFVSYGSNGRVIESSSQMAGFTGNECVTGNDCRLYFSAAILITKRN